LQTAGFILTLKRIKQVIVTFAIMKTSCIGCSKRKKTRKDKLSDKTQSKVKKETETQRKFKTVYKLENA